MTYVMDHGHSPYVCNFRILVMTSVQGTQLPWASEHNRWGSTNARCRGRQPRWAATSILMSESRDQWSPLLHMFHFVCLHFVTTGQEQSLHHADASTTHMALFSGLSGARRISYIVSSIHFVILKMSNALTKIVLFIHFLSCSGSHLQLINLDILWARKCSLVTS